MYRSHYKELPFIITSIDFPTVWDFCDSGMTSTQSYFDQGLFQNQNSSTSNFTEKQLFILKQPTHMIAIYSIAYSIVFLCALFGNLMVVTVVVRNRAMRTVTNCFIVNLAVADILVAVFNLPITLLSNLYLGK